MFAIYQQQVYRLIVWWSIDEIYQDLVGKSPAIASVVQCSLCDALSWAVISLQLPRALMLLIILSWGLFIPGVYIWSHLSSPPHSEHKFACSKWCRNETNRSANICKTVERSRSQIKKVKPLLLGRIPPSVSQKFQPFRPGSCYTYTGVVEKIGHHPSASPIPSFRLLTMWKEPDSKKTRWLPSLLLHYLLSSEWMKSAYQICKIVRGQGRKCQWPSLFWLQTTPVARWHTKYRDSGSASQNCQFSETLVQVSGYNWPFLWWGPPIPVA